MVLNKNKIKLLCYKIINNKQKVKKYSERIAFEQKQQVEIEKNKEKNIKEYKKLKSILNKYAKFRKDKHYDITCFIVSYNHRDTIEKCLKSILNQKTKYSYLIKVLDDNSKDGTIDVLLKYVKKYPDKIQLVVQANNTHGMHISAALRDIKTQYWCMIDGDDYWINKKKLQIALDCLNNNKDYVMFGHDSVFYNHVNNTKKSYVHDILKIKHLKKVDFNTYTYIHMSSRVYRNIINWKNEFVLNRKRDFFIYFAYLDKGPLYYVDKKMSVYNYTKLGVFSGLDVEDQKYSNKYMYYTMNKNLNYRHDNFFKRMFEKKLMFYEIVFGKKLGWFLFMKIYKYKFLFCRFYHHKKILKTIEKGHNPFDDNFLKFCEKEGVL